MPDGDKTQDATPRRREEAREKGQVARSQDLASAVVLIVALILLLTRGYQLAELLFEYGYRCLSTNIFLGSYVDADGLKQEACAHWYAMTMMFLKPMAVILLTLVAFAIGVSLFQTGLLWVPNNLSFDITRLNPIKGMQRIFSMQSLVRLGMGFLKLIVVSVVAYYAVAGKIEQIINSVDLDERELILFLLPLALWVALKVAVALAILAILDYIYQKWKHEQDLKMTTQEVRDEMKNAMGDPKIISKRRQVQREMAMQRMGQAVPQADVVVTNPTHLAVALRYDPETMQAPIVTAKGADEMARQIRKIALENGVPIIERKPLAQALFKNVEVGQTIPAEHYAAVAEILAYVYNLKGKKAPLAA